MAETWVLNTALDSVLQLSKTTISFTSNGQSYAAISFRSRTLVYYTNPYSSSGTSAYAPRGAHGYWTNDAYKTIVFDSSPTGSLLSWLQKNGTKQVEPKPEAAKHICLINGVGYSIIGGKTLIRGTAYNIESGKALIGGVGYDISLSKKLSVDIQGTFTYSTVEVGGTSYTVAGVVKAKAQTQITVTANGNSQGIRSASIYYNGRTVATGSIGMGTQTPATYSFSLETDTTITCTDHSGGGGNHATITITTS